MNYTYRYTYSRGSSTAIWVISGIVAVVLLIAAGKTLKKAGHNPWKILIPIYGGYLLYKIADAEGFFWGTLAVSAVSSVIARIVVGSAVNRMSYGYYDRSAISTPVLIITIIAGVIILILQISYVKKLASAFGKGGGFAAGLFLLYPIFIMILGFGSAQYVGYKGLDGVASTTSTWKCSSCGEENLVSRGNCGRCGLPRKQ